MTSARDHMSKADTVTIAAIEAGVPTLVAARTLTDRFHTMIRNGKEADLVSWIAAASDSLIGSFASGVTKDIAAVNVIEIASDPKLDADPGSNLALTQSR
jgi:hypothetical protein